MASTPLQPQILSESYQELLHQCFSVPNPPGLLPLYHRRPEASDLRQRITVDLAKSRAGGQTHVHPPEIMEKVLKSINRTWDKFEDGAVLANDFLTNRHGDCFEIATIEGKGRGLIASREIVAGETILREFPIIQLPGDIKHSALVLNLPRRALEAILLLHNHSPDSKWFSAKRDVPTSRFLDLWEGIRSTNAFRLDASTGNLVFAVVHLRGSLFNHSNTPNVDWNWDSGTDMMVFSSLRNIKKGDELVIDDQPGVPNDIKTKELEKAFGIV